LMFDVEPTLCAFYKCCAESSCSIRVGACAGREVVRAAGGGRCGCSCKQLLRSGD
jgi:hypothetical protein